MKTLKIKYLMTVLLLLIYSSSNSQSDTNKIYFTNDISIDYNEGLKEAVSYSTGKKTFVDFNQTIHNISKLRILNDSIISVTNQSRSDVQLNIDKINSVSIKSGGNTALGIALGALAGLGIGLIVGAATDKHDHKSGGWGIDFYVSPTAVGALTGISLGALIGGIIGGNIPGYKNYDLNYNNLDKKKELKRVLDINKKLNDH